MMSVEVLLSRNVLLVSFHGYHTGKLRQLKLKVVQTFLTLNEVCLSLFVVHCVSLQAKRYGLIFYTLNLLIS